MISQSAQRKSPPVLRRSAPFSFVTIAMHKINIMKQSISAPDRHAFRLIVNAHEIPFEHFGYGWLEIDRHSIPADRFGIRPPIFKCQRSLADQVTGKDRMFVAGIKR